MKWPMERILAASNLCELEREREVNQVEVFRREGLAVHHHLTQIISMNSLQS